MKTFSVNGNYYPSGQPVITVDDLGYKFGDGVFETMKVYKGRILLESFHMERLFTSLRALKIPTRDKFTQPALVEEVLHLCKENECADHARVRLSVYRANERERYFIECWPLDESVSSLNEPGFTIDVFPGGLKPADEYSSFKTANFIAYVMAIGYAKEHQLDDCLLLNQYGRIADSTISNVFIIKNKIIYTNTLKEGSINGVMRRHLLENLPGANYEVQQKGLTIEDIETADEVFLTNAVRGIRWVGKFRYKTYGNDLTKEIYRLLVQTLF
jgi:branched-chain amino acid aminotransferase